MVVLLVRAIRLYDESWKISAGVGLGSILLAIMSGSEFISTQAELYSFAMSLLFVVAVVALCWGIYKTKG